MSNLLFLSAEIVSDRMILMKKDAPREPLQTFPLGHFAVEFLNRIGENIVVFDYITKEVAWQILDAKLTDFQESVLERAGIRCDFSAVKEILFSKVLDNLENGGRGINNILEKYLINPLTRHIFDDRIQPGEQRIVTALLTEQIPTDLLWEPAIHVKGAFLNA